MFRAVDDFAIWIDLWILLVISMIRAGRVRQVDGAMYEIGE